MALYSLAVTVLADVVVPIDFVDLTFYKLAAEVSVDKKFNC